MIELIMYFGIGFLVASLFALLFMPLVHNRAVRLTMRRLEAATPLTMAEIRADKDQLRAEFAMSTRRLEMSVEQLKTRTSNQLAELGKKNDAINQLKRELGEKTAAIFAIEARDKALLEQIRAAEEEFNLKSSALKEAEHQLAEKEAELAKMVAELGEQAISADAQRVELATLRTQVEAMKLTVADYERSMRQAEEKLAREQGDAATRSNDLSEARGQLDMLSARAADLEQHLGSQTSEAELLNRRVNELEARLSEQGRILAERDYEMERLRGEAEAARRAEADLREELAQAGEPAIAEKFKAEIAEREAQIAALMDERAKLQAQIGVLQNEAESSWVAERTENAMLRERINDVAAEVARLTAVLEGPNSPIETLLAEAPSLQAPEQINGNGGFTNSASSQQASAEIAGINGQGTLADRVRALQAAASRVATQNR